MLILGECHTFNAMETAVFKEYFDAIIYVDLDYSNLESDAIINKISNILKSNNISIIVLNSKRYIPNTLLSYLVKLESEGIQFLSTETIMEKYLSKCYIPKGQTNITFLEKIRPYSKIQYIQKRFVDYGAVLVIGLLSSPIMLHTIYRILKESPGSILFKQDRVGLNDKIFTCYKFRSMEENSHNDPYTRENDDRLFSWGKRMRKRHIDELPQLWNVLKGDMHLIGPRAEWDILAKEYEEKILHYRERYLVRPGIAGWAQVNYSYGSSIEDAKEKLMYDLYYIKNWSFWLELKTCWLTGKAMFLKKGR